MPFYGDDSWDYPPRRPLSARRAHNEARRSGELLSPDPAYGAGSLHRTRSHSHSPQPIVNVYNDLYSAQDANLRADPHSPPYPPTPAPYPPSPEFRDRRLGERLGDEILAEELADMRLERRMRSRSRGPSDPGVLERRPDYYQMELARLEREKRELEQRDMFKREEDRIKAQMEVKRLKEEAKRETEETRREEEKKRIVADYERKKREDADKARAAEIAMMEKIEREKREAKNKEEREYREFLHKQKEKEEKEKREKKEEQEKIDGEMRKRLRLAGFAENQIEAIIDQEKAKKLHQGELPSNALQPWRAPHAPVYAKVHRDYLDVQTLRYYDIPYDYDHDDPGYIIILREMDKHETDVLFEHTKRLRAGKLLIEAPGRKPDYAWYRKKERSKSRGRGEWKKVGILEVKK